MNHTQKGINSCFGQACVSEEGADSRDKTSYNLTTPIGITLYQSDIERLLF